MLFDFKHFEDVLRMVYMGDNPCIEDVLGIFDCYFLTYELYFCRPHPPIKAEQILRIIDKLAEGDEDLEYYSAMIARHFKTQYQPGCDYNINHFFSGKIRQLRFKEVLQDRR